MLVDVRLARQSMSDRVTVRVKFSMAVSLVCLEVPLCVLGTTELASTMSSVLVVKLPMLAVVLGGSIRVRVNLVMDVRA